MPKKRQRQLRHPRKPLIHGKRKAKITPHPTGSGYILKFPTGEKVRVMS